jgi:dihydrofolate synthase/folylpolyglutamate synthase
VLEVGLGGRLDATNVVTPAVAVITSLSYDHTAILGETLAEIAAEKAGIVKAGVPVVSAPQCEEARTVIEQICRRRGAPLTVVDRDWTWEAGHANLDGQTFAVRHGKEEVAGLWVPLLGEHQLENATTAMAALSLLRACGVELPEAAIRNGFRSVRWPGRLEILGRTPLVVADSAHNGESSAKLIATLPSLLKFQRLIVILGASSDHVTPEVLTTLLSGADRAIATRSRHPRAADPEWLRQRAGELGFQLELSDTVPQALDLALADAGWADLICCTGSVFVAAEARAAWFARQGMPAPPSDPT